jgi:thiol-disulfide isomerase/thioredoxin
MGRKRIAAALILVGLFFGKGTAWSATPAQILQYRPRQEGIQYSTPRPEEYAACKVHWTKPADGPGQWLLLDPQGRPLRRLLDTNGDNRPDIWCYYLDGVEVYREIDSDFDGEPDQYRWLNSAGMKWGVDSNHDHKIDTWRMISAEEVSQEILQALVTHDFARLQALFLTEAEMQDLPASEAARITALEKQASAKFQAAIGRLTTLSDKSHWLHLETTAPQCAPADTTGARQDLIKYARATILCETEGKNEWIQTGEMIKIGLTWRIIDAPTVGDGASDTAAPAVDPALQTLLDQLRDLDQKAPRGDTGAGAADLATYNLARAGLLEQIRDRVKPEEREQWIRQIADCLSAASQNSPETDRTAYERLLRLEQQVIADSSASALAAYVTFREMQADNASRLARPGPDIAKIQEGWLERLSKFISTYPQAEDAPEALMQLGMVSEFVGKEIEAKNWYARLVKDFPQHVMAAKAQGALRRMDLEGKPLELAGTLLDGSAFNIDQLRGKVVVIYYWASWNKDRCIGDFAVLKQLLDNYAAKGLALVTVNLDNTAEEANAFLQRTPAPGNYHLFQAGGLDSPLATQYGVMVLPNLFLVDKGGKVISRTLQQVNGLEEELKKRLE